MTSASLDLQNSPPSPPPHHDAQRQRSLSRQISALAGKITKAFSNDLTSDRVSPDSSEEQARSVSRGREYFQSSGRGGAGNIRRASASREPVTDGPDDFSSSRGREYAVNVDRILSTGRGGAGNIRSPSRDPSGQRHETPGVTDYEQKVIQDHLSAEQDAPYSSGRGGFGNMSRSRSRGPALPTPVHSTGKGGTGNIKPGYGGFDDADDAERREHAHAGGIHSTGRGGLANLTEDPVPSVEHNAYQPGEIHSSGRGGIGNIRDTSREPRGSSKDKHGLLWNKFNHDAHKGSHESVED
jgi:hypothetical protein